MSIVNDYNIAENSMGHLSLTNDRNIDGVYSLWQISIVDDWALPFFDYYFCDQRASAHVRILKRN